MFFFALQKQALMLLFFKVTGHQCVYYVPCLAAVTSTAHSGCGAL